MTCDETKIYFSDSDSVQGNSTILGYYHLGRVTSYDRGLAAQHFGRDDFENLDESGFDLSDAASNRDMITWHCCESAKIEKSGIKQLS